MEPTIYKPSIYEGAGIYNTGAEGGGGGDSWGVNAGKEYITSSSGATPIIITNEYMQVKVAYGQTPGDAQRFGACPNYSSNITWDDLEIGAEIELNEIANVLRYGSGRTQLFSRCGLFNSQYTDTYKFEINNYDGQSWFYIFGNSRGGQFSFSYNRDIVINFLMTKTDVDKVNFKCIYENDIKFNSELQIPEARMTDTCLPAFGGVGQNIGLIYNNKLLKGSYIRINNDILFGEPL